MKKNIKKHINLSKAAYLSILSAFFLSIMLAFIKIASKNATTGVMIAFRYSVSFIYIVSILLFKKIKHKKVVLKTKHFHLYFFRSLVIMLSMFFLYYSLKFIPLVDGNLLAMTNPFFIPIIGFFFLHSKTNIKHIIAIIIGFIGVGFILKPGHDLFNPKALYALASGLLVAISFIIIRKTSKADDTHISMFYNFTLAFLFSLIIAIFDFKKVDLITSFYLLMAGISGALYQHLLIKGSKHASAKIISTLLFTSVVFSVLFQFLIFNNLPDFYSFIGMALIIVSSILTLKFAKKII